MDIDFFKLKYLITNKFYMSMVINKYSYEDSISMCYEEFVKDPDSNSIENMVAIATILDIQKRDDARYLEKMKKVIELFDTLPVSTMLNENEYEYIENDIRWIRRVYNELLDKKQSE